MQPMSKKQRLHERDQILSGAEAQAQAELDRLRSLRSEIAAEIQREAELDSEAQLLAQKQGIPADVARGRIARERAEAANAGGPVDTLKMSPSEYQRYKRERGL